MSAKAAIAVVGSLNVDFTYRVPQLPGPGETVASQGMAVCFGGKGANQALAARRAGAEVEMIGCAGDDDHGRRYLEFLRSEGIGTGGMAVVEGVPTGSAVIVVDDAGENTIVVEPGANHRLTREMLEGARDRIERAAVLLVQLECPVDAVRDACEMARRAERMIVFNPSPWLDSLLETRPLWDHLLVNESEAARLLGRELGGLEELDEALLEELGLASLVVTRGGKETWALSRERGRFALAPPEATPIDTVGAGDSFAGAYAVAVAEGRSLEDAVRFANAAGALATQQRGAQAAIPGREAILRAARLDA